MPQDWNNQSRAMYWGKNTRKESWNLHPGFEVKVDSQRI